MSELQTIRDRLLLVEQKQITLGNEVQQCIDAVYKAQTVMMEINKLALNSLQKQVDILARETGVNLKLILAREATQLEESEKIPVAEPKKQTGVEL
jgi:hypothetical protein